MTLTLIVAAPLLVLLIFTLFGFTGCTEFSASDEPATPAGGTTYASIVQKTTGYTGHWALNETGGTTATVSGPLAPNLNGIHKGGSTPGAASVLAKKEPNKNFAADLNGSSAYIEVPFDVRLNLQNNLRFTLELWVKPRAGNVAAAQTVISSHQISAGGNQRGYEIALIPSAGPHAAVRARVFAPNVTPPSEVVVTPSQGDPQAWRHIVLTYDGAPGATGKKLTLFVSVVGTAVTLDQSIAGSKYEPVQSARPLRFGAGHQQAADPPVDYFNGLIDEVAFYNELMFKTVVEDHFKAV